MNKKKYDNVTNVEPGIYKAVKNNEVRYVAVCDYGRQQKLDKKTGTWKWKQTKTELTFSTLKEARSARAEAVRIREIGVNTSGIASKRFCDVMEAFKESERYRSLDESYQDHFDNYIRHFVDFFGEMEVDKISAVDIENYYAYQMERGNLACAKRNKDGTVSKKEGISINTLAKHKTALKRIWGFMSDAKVYGVIADAVEKSNTPKVEIEIDGKKKKVSRIEFHPRSLTLEELNYTLNDAVQHEFDRSIAVMLGLAAIGSLRHSEVVGLKIGKAFHDEYMDISPEIWSYSGYDEEYYKKHEELMMIDTAVMDNRVKFPKYGIVRVIANPKPLREILDYAMEQRKEVLKLVGRELTSDDTVYMPLINLLDNRKLNSQKLSRKWNEYQKRRNKRMERQGLKTIPVIRFHDLRHTFSNLTKPVTFEWERSFNMGHKVKGENTTDQRYNNDRIVNRDKILSFFDENIKIDWDKALHKKISECGKAFVNGSGHLALSEDVREQRKKEGKKRILTEEEWEGLLGQ